MCSLCHISQPFICFPLWKRAEGFLAGALVAGRSIPLEIANGDANFQGYGSQNGHFLARAKDLAAILIPRVSKFGSLASVVFL